MRSFHDVEAINDPKKSQYGAPDFVFQRNSNRDIVLGYAEAKDVGEPLDKVEGSEQMRRYAGYQNLFLTDYLEFRFYNDGERYKIVRIANLKDGKLVPDVDAYERLAEELASFLELPPQQISSGERLAEIMGSKARRLREDVKEYFDAGPPDNQDLVKIFGLMKRVLVHDLDRDRFADMYAQTLVYGLFVARYNDPSPQTFSRDESRLLVPKTNPFLRNFFDHIVGPNFDERLARAVDELCDVFRVSDVKELIQRHLHSARKASYRDPVIHFYEDFLQAYDADLRRSMGAYYTPLPVVRYMIRQVDQLLKSEFNIPRGLADSSKIKYTVDDGQRRTYKDRTTGGRKTVSGQEVNVHRVQILDPAVGTATFLNEIIKHVHSSAFARQQGRWPSYVEDDLVPRLNGFEYMMAPYTIAHLKLGMTLTETGADELRRRLRVFLTNSLEEGTKQQPDLFSFGLAEVVTEESREASVIKSDRPIMVVIGNPPYLAQSSNDTPYANSLVAKYKFEPGGQEKLRERKHWLNDDYLKFIAFAEEMVKKNGEGIVAMITAHGYLHGKTSRGVRWRLTQTFDKIYALDLHGNVKLKEISPDGERDENVFDIQQGVSILFAIKSRTNERDEAEVYSADLFGTRTSKFRRLDADDVSWSKVDLNPSTMRFVNTVAVDGREKYEEGVALNELFLVSNTSLVTARDGVVLSILERELRDRMSHFASNDMTDDEVRQWLFAKRRASQRGYAPGDTRGWKLSEARKTVRSEAFDEHIRQVSYRPFDSRWIYYSESMVDWPRLDVMKHMLLGPNVGLVFRRQAPEKNGSTYFFMTNEIISDGFIKSDNKGSESLAPLYLYQSDGYRSSNLKDDKVRQLTQNLSHLPSHEHVFDYVYGVVHSPTYREKFQVLIREDFARIPTAYDDAEFERFRAAGEQLRLLHLLRHHDVDNFVTTYPKTGSDTVGRVKFEDSRIWINENQYIGDVPEVAWDFTVGAYKPVQKWLEQRRNRILQGEDIDHLQRVIKSLSDTSAIMSEVDAEPASWA